VPSKTGPSGDSLPPGESAVENRPRGFNVFDGLALIIVLGIAGAGYFIGSLGGDGAGGPITVDFIVTPDREPGGLPPGTTKTLPLVINNTDDYGVRVHSISAGNSNATPKGCPAGSVSSAPVDGPAGYIRPGGFRAYEVFVTMDANSDDRCKGQTFTLPLTVTLVSAAGDRGK
jgi:hypothetical protein